MRPYEHPWGESPAADQVWALVVGMVPDDAGGLRLMTLQAYIDDSRKDGMIILAGHVASVENWALLSKEWSELLPLTHINKHGRREFKMSLMMATSEGIENIQPFYRLIERFVDVSLSVYLNERDIAGAISRIEVSGYANKWDPKSISPFILAFKYLMDNFHAHRPQFDHWLDPTSPVDFIFDQDGNAAVLMGAWENYVESRDPELRKLYGAIPVFRDSEKFMALQAADLWAGWVRSCYETGNLPGIHEPDFGHWKAKPGQQIVRKEFTEDEIVKFFIGHLRRMVGSGPIITDNKA